MYQPIVPAAGLAGWRFLQRTYDSQFDAFNQSSVLKRDTEYFADKISEVSSAEELVSDRRLLSVVLGAFGLQDDINNRYFIQKVLEEGTASDDALAVRLSDGRYRDLADALGFGPTASVQTATQNFAVNIIAQYQASSFEVAAGTQDNALRIALYAQRELPELATTEASVDTKWFTVLGDPPLRDLFERALNLPRSIGQIDIDQQLGVFKDRAVSVFGTDDLSIFKDLDRVQDAITKFIVRDQLGALNTGLSGSSIALTLLQS